jgi:hypothetical protein
MWIIFIRIREFSSIVKKVLASKARKVIDAVERPVLVVH